MDRLTLRLSPDLLHRFDMAAQRQGGRSQLLRRLIETAAGAPAGEILGTRPVGPTGKLTLRLGEADLKRLEATAACAGFSRTQWTMALIRRRLHAHPQFNPSDTLSLIDARRELRRIGVNINQAARVLNAAVLAGRPVASELARLELYQSEARVWVQAIGDGFKGNLDYWSVGS